MGKKTKPSVAPMMEILSETKKKKKKKHTVDPEEESIEPVSPEKTKKKKKLDDNLNIEHSPSKEDAPLGNEESAEEMEVIKKKKKKKNKKEGHDESLNDSEVLTDSQKSPKKRSSTAVVKSSPKKLKKEKSKVEDEDEENYENDENEQVNIDEAETLDLWTTEERLALISKMQEKIQPNDKFSYRRRIASAKWKWDEIAFGNKSAKECEEQFNELIHHITKVKTLEQILLEAEQLTKTGGVRKKNLNPFQCFMKEHTQTLKTQSKHEGLRGRELFSVLINKWYSLDEKEKEKYKARAKEEASWEGHAPAAPRLPFEIYYDIESEKIGSKSLQLKNELKTKYASLKKKVKVKYIEESFKEVHEYKKKAAEHLKQNPSYKVLKKQPNKEETELYLVNHLKMPKGPPFQTRIAYYHRLMEEGKLDNVTGKDKLLTATRMFAQLPAEEQKAFTEETKMKFEEFQEKFAEWREKQEDYLADVIKRYEPELPLKKEKVEVKKKAVKLEEFEHTQVTVMSCPKFNDPPKRPPSSGFFLFSAKFEHKMKGKFSTMKERKQSCKAYWEKLPAEHKQIYNNRCKELKEEYHKNLLEFVGKLEEGERIMFLGHYRKPLRKFFKQDVFEEKYPNRIYPVYITSPTKKSKEKVNGTTVKQQVEEDDTSSNEDDLSGAQNKTKGIKKSEKKTKNVENNSSDYSSDEEEEEEDRKPQLQKKGQEVWDSSSESSSDTEDDITIKSKLVKTPKEKQKESNSSKVVKSKSPTKKQTPLAGKATSKMTTKKEDSSSDSSSDESEVIKPSWMTPTSQKTSNQTADSSEEEEESDD